MTVPSEKSFGWAQPVGDFDRSFGKFGWTGTIGGDFDRFFCKIGWMGTIGGGF
ncbi:hypothetical protein [Neobacillus vireti]|uniref:hypothetical protein n=1 Tax=Neobacillus vireti TaxID=220686 RepID=UPI0012E21772|nr:hypothetical protein [Neobacillus vireti]